MLNIVCQSCMAKAPWERPTAAQLSDFANKVLNGDSPKPVWIASADEADTPAAPAPAVPVQPVPMEPSTPVSPSAPAAPAAEPAYAPAGKFNQTIAISDPHSLPSTPETPAFQQVQVQTEPESKSFGAFVWIGAAIAGLAIGFLLNYFV
jgi:hypothetical protein